MGWVTEWSEVESGEWQEFSLLHVIKTGLGPHPASYPMGAGGFPRVKQPGHEGDHLSQISAEVKRTWKYMSTNTEISQVYKAS
jgi:hypothetical protein